VTRIRVAAGLLFNESNDVFMAQRPKTSRRPGLWEFPGGKYEASDGSLVKTLAREWKEELGVIVDEKQVHRVTTIDLFVEEHFEVNLLQLKLTADSPAPEPHEAQDIVWANMAWSVMHRPLVPSCYLFYRHVMDLIRKRENLRTWNRKP